jgi:hypothetical protein
LALPQNSHQLEDIDQQVALDESRLSFKDDAAAFVAVLGEWTSS